MHGWFHFDWWLAYIAEPLGGAQVPAVQRALDRGHAALQNPLVILFYAVGILACVFHLANGLWTMGITWGAWTSPPAQKKALYACGAFGAALLGDRHDLPGGHGRRRLRRGPTSRPDRSRTKCTKRGSRRASPRPTHISGRTTWLTTSPPKNPTAE